MDIYSEALVFLFWVIPKYLATHVVWATPVATDTNGKDLVSAKQLHFCGLDLHEWDCRSKAKFICYSDKCCQIAFHKGCDNSYFSQETKIVLLSQHFYSQFCCTRLVVGGGYGDGEVQEEGEEWRGIVPPLTLALLGASRPRDTWASPPSRLPPRLLKLRWWLLLETSEAVPTSLSCLSRSFFLCHEEELIFTAKW